MKFYEVVSQSVKKRSGELDVSIKLFQLYFVTRAESSERGKVIHFLSVDVTNCYVIDRPIFDVILLALVPIFQCDVAEVSKGPTERCYKRF